MTLIGADACDPEYIVKKVGFTDSISKEPVFLGELISITPRVDHPINRRPASGHGSGHNPGPVLEKSDAPPPKLQAVQEQGDALTPQLPARFECALGGRHRKWEAGPFLLPLRAFLDHNERDLLLGNAASWNGA